MTITRDDVLTAGDRIAGRVRRTPLLRPSGSDGTWLKLEHLQHCGVFKTRGAFNRQLAAIERGELAVIEEFLPRQMDEAETRAAIDAVKAELGAAGLKDMGRVMAELKARHGRVLDMSRASGWVKESLG